MVCETILDFLRDGLPETFLSFFRRLVSKSTLSDHLSHLVGSGLVLREQQVTHRRSRPSFRYRLSRGVTHVARSDLDDLAVSTLLVSAHVLQLLKG